MINITYVPIVKISDAETRGVENLSDDVKNTITPLFELTRSRRSKKVPRGDIYRRLNRLEEAYGNSQFILDLTSDPALRNRQIEDLQNNVKGYKNWVSFISSLEENFDDIIPVIQISDIGVDNARDFYNRIKRQVHEMSKIFNNIIYRFPLGYNDFAEDIDVICQEIYSDKIICLIDAGFITQEKSTIYSQKAIDVVEKLKDFSLGKLVLAATSFPKNPTEFGGENEGEYQLEEILFYNEVISRTKSDLIYGDYATINPIRVEQAGGRGWVPRIDMSTKEDAVFYFRSRKKKTETNYAPAYIRVAKRMVQDRRYQETKDILDNCWGIEQIELAAQGYPQGLSPSFWISVRMNIHITLRVSLL
jgi:hypothetical protein